MVDTHSQQDLQSRAQHLDVLVVQETPRDGDDVVVVRGHVRVQHRRHQAAGAVLHPPGAVKRCVERHQEVPVLNIRIEKKGNVCVSGVNLRPYGQSHRLDWKLGGYRLKLSPKSTNYMV